MGVFGWLKDRFNNFRGRYAPTQTGYTPVFSDFGDSIYASDIVVQSIRCIANEMMKLNPRHIRTVDGKQMTITDSSIARVLKNPNAWMTTADFLSKITVLRELTKNAYIYMDSEERNGKREFLGAYPLKPQTVEYLTDLSNGSLWLRFTFGNGNKVTLPQQDIVHWRKDYGVDDYFGGALVGAGEDNIGMLKTLELYNTITQSIAEALKCSLSINGVMQYVTLVGEEKLKAERDRFVADLRAGKSTVLFLDNKAEYKNIPRDVKIVDKDTLEFFHKTILRSTGVSLPILNGDYTDSQKSAFYETVLEAPIIALGQALTKTVFQQNRQAAFGNEIVLYPDQIQNMSMEKRIAWLGIAVPAGAVNKNEIRMTIGLPPIEGGEEFPRGYNNLDSGTMGTNKDDGNKGTGAGTNEE